MSIKVVYIYFIIYFKLIHLYAYLFTFNLYHQIGL